MYCLRLFIVFFYKNYIVYYNVYCYYCGAFIERHVYTKMGYCGILTIYVPIVMYGMRLFIVVLQELHCLLNCLHVCMIRVRGCYHIIKFCYSTLSGF